MTNQKNTFLFSWNPIKFSWPELGEESKLVKQGKKIQDNWTCASHKKIKIGDGKTALDTSGQRHCYKSGIHINKEVQLKQQSIINETYIRL